jgi:hypothetical protein
MTIVVGKSIDNHVLKSARQLAIILKLSFSVVYDEGARAGDV